MADKGDRVLSALPGDGRSISTRNARLAAPGAATRPASRGFRGEPASLMPSGRWCAEPASLLVATQGASTPRLASCHSDLFARGRDFKICAMGTEIRLEARLAFAATSG